MLSNSYLIRYFKLRDYKDNLLITQFYVITLHELELENVLAFFVYNTMKHSDCTKC